MTVELQQDSNSAAGGASVLTAMMTNTELANACARKLRQHRGGLDESMATTVEIEATMPALLAAMQPVMEPWGVALTPDAVHVTPYGGIDKRIGWDTHVVTLDGYGVYGFTDGPLHEPPNAKLTSPQ